MEGLQEKRSLLPGRSEPSWQAPGVYKWVPPCPDSEAQAASPVPSSCRAHWPEAPLLYPLDGSLVQCL